MRCIEWLRSRAETTTGSDSTNFCAARLCLLLIYHHMPRRIQPRWAHSSYLIRLLDSLDRVTDLWPKLPVDVISLAIGLLFSGPSQAVAHSVYTLQTTSPRVNCSFWTVQYPPPPLVSIWYIVALSPVFLASMWACALFAAPKFQYQSLALSGSHGPHAVVFV